ncbi:MAG TPA: AMP-binding protein [Rhodocyclaceae bacterium]|nr:AMP-binding protein [Rhodocyclaceae bacterium]
MNAAQMLLAGKPEAVALVEDDGSLTYAELRALATRCATAWKRRGIRPGDRCVVALRDGVDWVGAFLGLIWIGALPIAVSSRTAQAQLHDLMTDSGAVALLLEDEAAQAFGDIRSIGRTAWRAELPPFSGDPAPTEVDDDAPAFLLYSSGTTGKPKGIVHAHRAARDAHVFARDVLGATSRDRFYATSKLFFAYPLANALFAGLRLGASVVLDPEWPDPGRVVEQVRRHTPTLLFSVPTLYRRMVEARVGDFPAVRAAVSAGEACPPDLAEAWRKLSGITLVNGYGTTETLSLVLYRTATTGGSIATPCTCIEVEAAQDADQDAFRLWFSHPAVALGYARAVAHDSACFGANGFSPGDLFRRADDDGGWRFAGRSDQLLKVFGRWVDTLAIESLLLDRLAAAVSELCIVPSGTGDRHIASLHLFVVPGPGPEVALREEVAAAIACLPAYQRPAEVHFVKEFPRTETGKLRRGELAAVAR